MLISKISQNQPTGMQILHYKSNMGLLHLDAVEIIDPDAMQKGAVDPKGYGRRLRLLTFILTSCGHSVRYVHERFGMNVL